MISRTLVHSTQTVHLSCTEINTISKQTKTSFHLTHVTLKYHRVRPKWFLGLWYVLHKLCTYLAPILTHLQMDRNKLSLDIHYIGVLLGVPKVISKPVVHFTQIMDLSCVEIRSISKQVEMSLPLDPSPRSTIRYVQNDLWAYGTFGANHTPILRWD
jgi:hypothetical protein